MERQLRKKIKEVVWYVIMEIPEWDRAISGMRSRKPGMAQGMLRNTRGPVGEGSKPAPASKIQKIPTLTVFSSGLGSPEESDEPHGGFSLWHSRFRQILQN